VVCKYIYSIYLGPICSSNILHIIYDKNRLINNIKITFYHKKCIANNIYENTRIQYLGNVFFNAQQMAVQLVYCVLSLPLYHLFQTFKFINTSPYEECVFVLK